MGHGGTLYFYVKQKSLLTEIFEKYASIYNEGGLRNKEQPIYKMGCSTN